jgi:hypothetical protein
MSFFFSLQCYVDDGRRIRESLQNVDDVAKPSIVGKNVRVRHGARDIVFGVAPRKEMKMPIRLIRLPLPWTCLYYPVPGEGT